LGVEKHDDDVHKER